MLSGALLSRELECENAVFEERLGGFRIDFISELERAFIMHFCRSALTGRLDAQGIAFHMHIDIALFYTGQFDFERVNS